MPNIGLMTTAEVAAAWGVNVRTVNRDVKRGTLQPAAKAPGLRGAHLFDPKDVAKGRPEVAA